MKDYNSLSLDELKIELDKLESYYEHLIETANDCMASGIYPHNIIAKIEIAEYFLKYLKALHQNGVLYDKP